MSERTVCLPLLRLKPGMRLAHALVRADGATLMPAGAELTESALHQLPQRGIEFVFVTETESRDTETIARDIAAAEARVNHIFHIEDPAVPGMDEMREELHAAILAYRRAEVA